MPISATSPEPNATGVRVRDCPLAADGMEHLLPLAVDLDGTLIAGDSLHEGFTNILFSQPGALPGVLRALALGRAAFKRAVAVASPSSASALAVRESFVDWLRGQRAQGRELHLVTAADQSVAQTVADRLGLFD